MCHLHDKILNTSSYTSFFYLQQRDEALENQLHLTHVTVRIEKARFVGRNHQIHHDALEGSVLEAGINIFACERAVHAEFAWAKKRTSSGKVDRGTMVRMA